MARPKTAFSTKIEATCQRCGRHWEFDSRYLYRNYDVELCADCRAKPRTRVAKNGLTCLPWQGILDLNTMTPVDALGNPVKPGIRTCGNSDCMSPGHIIKSNLALEGTNK